MSEDLSPQAAALLRLSREHERGPDPERKSRILHLVQVSVAAGVAVQSSTLAAKAWALLSKFSIVSALTVGFGAGVVVAVPTILWSESARETHRTPPSPVVSQRQAGVGSAKSVPLSPPPATAPQPKTPPPPPHEVSPSARSAAEAPASNTHAELDLLRSAQQELQRGRPEVALRRLQQFDRRQEPGQFGTERMALRVFAYCQLGRVEEARREAERLLAVAPRSPLIPRIRTSCAGTPTPTPTSELPPPSE